MYLDSLSPSPNPHAVHTAFGALYQSLEATDSLIDDEQAVQIATLFHVNGFFHNAEITWRSAEWCFKEVLSDHTQLNSVNLGNFLQDVKRIANANNILVAALTGC